MNVANATGFFVLGALMHVAPELAASFIVSAQPFVVGSESVRAVWLDFMSWVVGGIGAMYLLREAIACLPALLGRVVPERLLRPVAVKNEGLPAGAQVGVSN